MCLFDHSPQFTRDTENPLSFACGHGQHSVRTEASLHDVLLQLRKVGLCPVTIHFVRSHNKLPCPKLLLVQAQLLSQRVKRLDRVWGPKTCTVEANKRKARVCVCVCVRACVRVCV